MMKAKPNDDYKLAVGEASVGIMDCIFGLGVALANAGIVSRAELASAFEEVTRQHKSNPDCQHPARQYPAAALTTMFRARTYDDDERQN